MPDFDIGYELLPVEGDVALDDALQEALNASTTAEDDQTPRPLGRGWGFDFAAGQFVKLGAAPQGVDGLGQLRVWIEKTLYTARLAHEVYTDQYGVEMPALYGQVFNGALAGQLQEAYTAALMVHDRITAVQEFSFDGDPASENLYVSFEVVVDGDETLGFSVPLEAI